MTVQELIDKLEEVEDKNQIVIMSKDAEGNNFSPFAHMSAQAYRSDSTWSGEIGLEELTPELEEHGYSEGDVMEDGMPAIVLWPVN